MNIFFATLGLLTATIAWSASEHPFKQLEIRVSEQSLSDTAGNNHGSVWLAYSLPAAEGTRSMCCYQNGKQRHCDLNKQAQGYGSSSDSQITEQVHYFIHLKDGQADQVMPVGDHCEVRAEGLTITWLDEVTVADSLRWLNRQVKNTDEDEASGSLYAISLHAGEAARETLFELASEQQDAYSEQAVFWLGQRNDGFASLEQLLADLPVGEVRRHINFALSQHRSTQAVALLKNIARGDQDEEQQADAIFWLSQTEDLADLPAFLLSLMKQTESAEIREKAVFSLSQIESDEASQALLELVKGHPHEGVREQALFWLAQRDPQQAFTAAMNLLKTSIDAPQQEHAVFVLSQLPGKQASQALFKVLKGDYPRSVKKQALFWLSQSDDAETLAKLEQLL